MLVGYNTNIPYKGVLYHVQTEDNGLKNPVIVTLLYNKGTILASKKVNYAHLASGPDFKEKVRQLMQEQHRSMIKELIHGKHTGEGSAETAEPEPEKTAPERTDILNIRSNDQMLKSLDDILLDYIMKTGKGKKTGG
jgi:hypothetical protein